MKGSGRPVSTIAFVGLLMFSANAIPSAFAQEEPSKYPIKPIHIIVGFAAGGGNDIIARIFGQKLSESLGQPVIVENKPGGGAIVATEYVAKSQADGYTLLMSASGISINPAVYAKLPYDAVKDFVAVSELGSFPLIMIVNASSPIKSVAELVAYAKANPDKMNYASSSASFQLVTELFKQKTGAPMQVIPTRAPMSRCWRWFPVRSPPPLPMPVR
jgi:tripartite-type tricarboxylate transporter receptor subunit TctC